MPGIRKDTRQPPLHVRAPQSLRTRLWLWNALLLLLTLAILGIIIYALVSYYLLSSQDKRLYTQGERLQTATTIWLNAARPVGNQLFNELALSLQQDEFTYDPLYIEIYDPQTGKVLRRSTNLQQSHIQYTSQDFQAALHGHESYRTYTDSRGDQVRVLTLPLKDTSNHVIAVIQVGRSLASIHQVQIILVTVFCVGSLFALLISYFISFWITRRELRPLQILSKTMGELSEQGLGISLSPTNRTIEIQRLTEAFNQMSERLAQSFTLQRNFVADVSHELRTPLTSMRGQVDVMLMDPELNEGIAQDVRQLRTELVRLSHLVSNLLAMARANIGMLPEIHKGSTPLLELDMLLIEIARQGSFLNAQVHIELGKLEQIMVSGDRDLLKQLLLNIVDNALIYTQPGGKVVLEVSQVQYIPGAPEGQKWSENQPWAIIHIRDNGPGILLSDLPHIFERNYRAKHIHARTRLGSGLGLSIASLIAEAHGGTITVESEPGKGTCFHIWLPVVQTEHGQI